MALAPHILWHCIYYVNKHLQTEETMNEKLQKVDRHYRQSQKVENVSIIIYRSSLFLVATFSFSICDRLDVNNNYN